MAATMDFESPDIDACLASYMPPSNLPTPPASTEHAKGLYECYNGSVSTMFDAYKVQTLSPYQSTAKYLVNSLPYNLANYSPCASSIAAYLDRAGLNDSIIGLAICILEDLSHRFVRSWRQSSFYAAVRHTKAEVVIVAALAVAASFVDDLRREARWWSNTITWEDFSTRQINVSMRCILADIEYELHAYTPEMIAEAVREARGAYASLKTTVEPACDEHASRETLYDEESEGPHEQGAWNGDTIWRHGLVTPEPSPVEEPMRFLRLL